MSVEIEEQALALLRSEAALAVPVSRLYHRLTTTLGTGFCGPGGFVERIRRRPDLFLILEPATPRWEAEAWSDGERDTYLRTLAAAGASPEPLIAPSTAALARTDASSAADALRLLDTALLGLWEALSGDPSLGGDVAEAIEGVTALRAALRAAPTADGTLRLRSAPSSPADRPTTPPPDPPPRGGTRPPGQRR